MDHTSLLVPRLTVLLVAPIEFAVVAWYFLYWDILSEVLNSAAFAVADLCTHWGSRPPGTDINLQRNDVRDEGR